MPHNITKNEPLALHTTLGVGGPAEYYAEPNSAEELAGLLEWAKAKEVEITVLGGGSNVLIDDLGIPGLIIRPMFTDLSYEEKDNGVVCVKAGAGIVLDELIQKLVDKGLWGLENLSSIPGMVGAVPIQNVGAYGVEAKDIVRKVVVFDMETMKEKKFTPLQCEFEYRDSIFKKQKGKKYIVTEVIFETNTKPNPKLTYKELRNYFKDNKNPSLKEIRYAIQEIRSNKLPDWTKLGTAGSFFKNPIIPKTHLEKIRKEYPEAMGFEVDDDHVKIPLGWILDNVCNLKGYTEGKVGLYEKQALVLVCEEGATSAEIIAFTKKVIDMVHEKTGICIEREVTTLPKTD
jgi:UDP-N-acetylmuramate dehydrogenase